MSYETTVTVRYSITNKKQNWQRDLFNLEKFKNWKNLYFNQRTNIVLLLIRYNLNLFTNIWFVGYIGRWKKAGEYSNLKV